MTTANSFFCRGIVAVRVAKTKQEALDMLIHIQAECGFACDGYYDLQDLFEAVDTEWPDETETETKEEMANFYEAMNPNS